MLSLNTAPATNTICPKEMRFLREATEQVATGCKRAARQSVVSYVWLSTEGRTDLRQEAKALDAEDELIARRPAMSPSSASL